jgi:cysteine-rich repeat protein
MLSLKAIRSRRWRTLGRAMLIGAAGVCVPALAQAHFILVTPDSWMSQDALGLPEKLGPCGDEGGGTPTGKVTAFRPGQTISVTINEVITHPGHYRVALAVNNRSELPAEPIVTPTVNDQCASAAIQSPATFPILADNVLPHTQAFPAPQTFTVTLPANVTCTKCTLQVLEFMSSHPAPCFYHHCADISIQGTPVTCGDGTVQAGEQCDDGNTMSGDGCDSTCRLETATVTPSNVPAPTRTPTGSPTPTGTAAATGCGPIARPMLTIGKLKTPLGDDTLRFQGTLTLGTPPSPALNPLANGIRLQIDAGGTLVDTTIPGGPGWTANGSGTKWMYRSKNPTAPAGIYKVVIRDRSAVTPGVVKFSVHGKAGSFPVASGDLPVAARLIIAPSAGGQCGDASFASCAFNATGNTLKCK